MSDGVMATLVANLPRRCLLRHRSLETRRIGSFIKMDGWYFRLWCETTRCVFRALLDLTRPTSACAPRSLPMRPPSD